MTHLCIKPHCGPDCSMCNGAVPLSRAAVDVLAERQRQITGEGWTPEHDDTHTRSELARAAASYLCRTDALMLAGTRVWPKGWVFKPAGYRRVLIKACALALAELERLDRYSQSAGVVAGVDVGADRLTVHVAMPGEIMADAGADRLIVTAALPGEIMESFVWNDAQAKKPDSDSTVLCWGVEGYFCGWWDDGTAQWLACEGGGTVLGVTHWADPQGPEL